MATDDERDIEREARIRQKTEELKEATSKSTTLMNPLSLPKKIILKPEGGVRKEVLEVLSILIFIGLIVGFIFYSQGRLQKVLLFILPYIVISIVSILFFIIIVWGFFAEDQPTSRFIAFAFIIWAIDLLPNAFIGWILGPPYAGFNFDIRGTLNTNWAAVITTPLFLSLLFFAMISGVIKRKWSTFLIYFVSFQAINWFFTYASVELGPYKYKIPPLPYFNHILLALIVITIFAFFYFKDKLKDRFGEDVVESITYIIMAFTFSFFFVNSNWIRGSGWRGIYWRPLLHFGYIIWFGLGYIRRQEQSNPSAWHLWMTGLLIADFYLYNFFWIGSSALVDGLQYLPVLVGVVLFYCSDKTESGYASFALVFIVGFFIISIITVHAIPSESIQFEARKGADYKDYLKQFGDKVRDIIEGRLDIATAGLYRGNVEKNRYESLGVYFTNIRAADPRFYKDDYITVWGSLRSKTYQDAVIINFSCYRWKDNKKISADKIIPELKFPIFTLEEVDTECTFFPSTEKGKEITPGPNTITFSADYNFGTDAYIKAYFMDRERFRAYTRENIDPLTELGIKDKKPRSISTNGPVEIGMGTGQSPITVSEGYAIKPSIGITLTNRQEIQDKDKRIITRWEGKIKNITELILLVPPGISLGGINEKQNLEKCYSKIPEERIFCPCSMPFVEYDIDKCESSCYENVYKICRKACEDSFKDNQRGYENCEYECQINVDKCNNECKFLFKVDQGEGSTSESYKGYALDVGSLEFKDLNKDIDKHRSFQCRFEPSSAVLGSEPITTRYFRVRARYNYLLENSVTINVEETPTEVLDTVPDQVCKIASEFTLGDDIYTANKVYKCDLISAIAWVESRFRHCCKEVQSRKILSGEWEKLQGVSCTPTNEPCDFDRLLTSGSSYGIMQINYKGKNKAWVDSLAQTHCGEKNINDYDCNMKVGEAILKEKYNLYKNGCGKYTKLETACKTCKSNRAPNKYYYQYEGIEAALRGYNGWACGNGADNGYVEKVKDVFENKIKKGVIVDNTGIREIAREGEGMADITTDQTDGQMLTGTEATQQQTTPPTSSPTERTIEAEYDSVKNIVIVSWKPIIPESSGKIFYKVEKYIDDIYDRAICAPDAAGKDLYSCIDDSRDFKVDAKYRYEVITYLGWQEKDKRTYEITPIIRPDFI